MSQDNKTKKCVGCGKVMVKNEYVKPWKTDLSKGVSCHWKKRKFCSVECYLNCIKNKLKVGQKIKKLCERCGKVMFRNSHSVGYWKTRRFCSYKCYWINNKIKKHCLNCKKVFLTWKKTQTFCSIPCIWEYSWKGVELTKKCLGCETKMHVKEATTVNMWKKTKYCSKKCSSLYLDIPTKNTSIEIKLQNELKRKGIKFKTQFHVVGRPDLFVEPNICIFADRDYWHGDGFPETRKRDKIVNKELKKQGYKVLRFWEHEIKKNVDFCINKILVEVES